MAGYCAAFPSWPRDTRSGLSADSDIQVVDLEFSHHPRAFVTIAGYFPIGRRMPPVSLISGARKPHRKYGLSGLALGADFTAVRAQGVANYIKPLALLANPKHRSGL